MLKLLRFKVFKPEFLVGFQEVGTLIAVIAMHSVRIYHEIEFLAFLVKGIKKLKSVLMVDIVVTGAVGKFEHDRFGRSPRIQKVLKNTKTLLTFETKRDRMHIVRGES